MPCRFLEILVFLGVVFDATPCIYNNFPSVYYTHIYTSTQIHYRSTYVSIKYQ